MSLNVTVIGFGPVGRQSLRMFDYTQATIVDTQHIHTLPERATYLHPRLPEFSHALSQSDVIVLALGSRDTYIHPTNTRIEYSILLEYFQLLQIVPLKPTVRVIVRTTLINYEALHRLHPFSYMPEFLTEAQLGETDEVDRVVIGGEVTLPLRGDYAAKAMYMSHTEAIAVKLYSNAFLATKVTFFNEVESMCYAKGLRSDRVIEAITRDQRIGTSHSRPGIGWGGKCLPKDVFLASRFHNAESHLVHTLRERNQLRIEEVAKRIIERDPMLLGIYRMISHPSHRHLEATAMRWLIDALKTYQRPIYVYEPLLTNEQLVKWFNSPYVRRVNGVGELSLTDLLISELNDPLLDELGVPRFSF